MTGMFVSLPTFAEDRQGDAVQIKRETRLRRDPTEDSPSLGRLPPGTILTMKGSRRGKYLRVEVELEGGDALEGWIESESLDRPARELESVTDNEKRKPRIKSGRISVPEDEGLLLRREPTFSYGLFGGANYSFLQTQYSNDFYSGIGFGGGGHIGYFVLPDLIARLEVGFNRLNGTSATDTTGLSLSFNFLDIAIVPSYTISNFEIFGGLQYSFGLGVGDIPAQMKAAGTMVFSTSDVNNFGLQAGAGYRFNVGFQTDLAVRAKYSLSFLKYPFSFQAISLSLALDIRG